MNAQLPEPPTSPIFPTVIAAMQRERLMRYMPAAHRDENVAFRFYLWNCHLSQSFHHALHFAEIVTRNALARALQRRCGVWRNDHIFRSVLGEEYTKELDRCIKQEFEQHRDYMTDNHIISALSFGFWNQIATKRFERFLWARGVSQVMPGAGPEVTRQDVHDLIESIRRWRNRIAHHRAIFDKGPMRKHQDALLLISWACADTGHWVSSISKVPAAIALRPK
jgi:hypothetical protein